MTEHEQPVTSHQSPVTGSDPITNHQSPAPSPEDKELSLLDLLIVLAKHKKLVLGLPLAATVLAAGISLLMPNIYTATAKILPPQQSQSTTAALLAQMTGLASVAAQSFGLQNPNDMYVGMLKSRTIADKLIARFGLHTVYGTDTQTDTRDALQAATTVIAGKDSIIVVQVDDEDPARAATLANAYFEELHSLTETLAVTEAAQRRLFFEQQLKRTKESLAEAEVALQETQERTGLIKLDEQGRAIIEAVAGLRAQIAAKEVQLAAMRSFATQSNPDYVRTREELAGLRVELAKLEKASGAVAGDIFVPTGKVPEVGLEYVRRLREVKYQEAIFELLAKQYELARADEAKDSSVLQILDRAVPPERKSKPKRALIVITTAFVVGVLSIIAAFAIDRLETAQRNPLEAEKLARLRRVARWTRRRA